MAPDSRSQAIDRQVMTWPGVSKGPNRFGGTESGLGRRESGHIHGESLVAVPLPRRLRDELIRQGRARPHHVLPDSGWVSVPMRSLEDVPEALSILRHSYDLAWIQREKRRSPAEVPTGKEAEGECARHSSGSSIGFTSSSFA